MKEREIDVRELIGIPFKAHGRDRCGMDCYGVALAVYEKEGVRLPDVFYQSTDSADNERTADALRKGLPLEKIELPQVPCLVDMAISGGAHVAVYIGNGMVVHATKDAGVCAQRLERFEKRIKGFYKVRRDDC